MAVNLQQTVARNTSSTTSVTTTLVSSPTTGNIIVAVVGANVSNTATSMSTPATGWTKVVAQDTNGANNTTIFARVVGAGEAAGYTARATSATVMSLSIYELSGAAATVAEAIQYSNSNTSGASSVATLSVGSITPPAGHSAVSINGIWWQGGTTTAQSINSSFTIATTGTLRGDSSHLVISATSGSYNPTYSWTTSRPTATAAVMVMGRPTAVESESITVTDTPALSVVSGPSASVSDSTVLSESVILSLTSNISKSDTVTTSESVATPTFTTGFNISLSESVTVTENKSVVRPAPVLSYTDLTMVAQETGTPYPDNPYIAGEFSPSGTYSIPTAVNDTRSYDVFAGDLGFAWDDGNSGVLVAFGDTFGHNWTGPNVTTAGGTGSPTIAAGSNGVNVNTFTGSGTLYLSSVAAFLTGGGVAAVELSSASNALVYISYTGKSGTTLTGCKTLLSASGTLTTGDRAKANDNWTGAGWRSNVLAYSNDTNLSNGYTISDFKNKTSQNIAQEIISAAHDSEVSTKVFTGSSLTISTIASTFFLVTVTTSSAHGLIAGQWVEITGTTNFNGEYLITGIPSSTKFTFTKLMADTTESAGTAKGAVYANVQNPLTSGYEGSLIPSGGMSIANGGGVGVTRQYLFYWSVIYFSPYASQWWTNYASVAYSDDGGATWTKTAAGTTVAAGSNGVDVSTFAGSGTLNVASAASFPSTSGTEIEVVTSNGLAYVTYTGKTATSFTGVTLVSGSGTLSTGNGVRRGIWGNNSTFTDNFQQIWPIDHTDGYVYLMAVQNGRYSSPRMMRVAEANVLKKSAYQYWDGSTWNSDYTQATNIFPDTEPVGEPSMFYNTGTQAWISTYYDSNANGIVARSAWTPEGPWSTKQTLLSNSAFGSADMYGGFIHPWSNTGSQSSYDLYFHISLFAPYSTFLMRAQTGVTQVNKSESVIVSESRNVTSVLQINKSETVTTSESLTLDAPTLISVTDASTVSESVSVNIPVNVTTSDSTTVSEAITTLITYYFITVTDTLTLTEAITLAPTLVINVSDHTTITTTVSLTRTGAITINVSDEIGAPAKLIYTTDGEVLYYVFRSNGKAFYEKI